MSTSKKKLANPNDGFGYPAHPGNRLSGQGDKGKAPIFENYSKNLAPLVKPLVNVK